MTHNRDSQIIAFVGLAGSGKSTAADYIADKGYPIVNFGRIVLDGMVNAGIDRTPESEKQFREDLRRQNGDDYLAKEIAKEINNLFSAGQKRIVADGLYSWTEYRYLKTEFPSKLTVVAVVAPRHLRHHRLTNRPVRPLSQFEADQRDWSEIEHLEKGGPIAVADYYIINDGSKEHLFEQLDILLKETEFLK